MESLFKERIKEQIGPIIAKFGFRITGEGAGFVKYSSTALVMEFAFDKRERSLKFFLGSSEEDLVLFDDDILSRAFGYAGRIDQVPVDQFISSLVSFFENDGKLLISGHKDQLRRLFDCQEERSEAYTASIREKQLRRLTDH